MAAENLVYLKAIPLVRRMEYFDGFLEGIRQGLGRKELMVALGEKKKAFEVEKDLALGRGNPHRKDITQANRLVEYCIMLCRNMRYIDKIGSKPRLLEAGRIYLEVDEFERRRMFAESFSQAYPHLGAIVLALSRLEAGDEAVLLARGTPEFKLEAKKYGLSIGQMYFDTVRDIGTSLWLLNWYVEGIGSERRQHVYLTCNISAEMPESFLLKIKNNDSWLFATPFEVRRNEFRDALWDVYLTLADQVPGAPVFYSAVREKVCARLKIRDDQFDCEIMGMVEWDDKLHVIWSEGVLQYQKDSANMLKSLPPKNEWGRYVVYLKIVRR